jgi:hypothetical protein
LGELLGRLRRQRMIGEASNDVSDRDQLLTRPVLFER